MDNSESLLTCAIHLRNCLPPPCSPPPLPTHKLPALPTPPHIYTHPGILSGANTEKGRVNCYPSPFDTYVLFVRSCWGDIAHASPGTHRRAVAITLTKRRRRSMTGISSA